MRGFLDELLDDPESKYRLHLFGELLGIGANLIGSIAGGGGKKGGGSQSGPVVLYPDVSASTHMIDIGTDAAKKAVDAARWDLDAHYAQVFANLNAYFPKADTYLADAKSEVLQELSAIPDAYRAEIAPALSQYRGGLTRSQEIARQDLLRQGQATLASSGLRGAGRAGVGALMNADERFLADAADRNRGQEAQLRSGIANVVADTAKGKAQTEASIGGARANLAAQHGTLLAQMEQAYGRDLAANREAIAQYEWAGPATKAQMLMPKIVGASSSTAGGGAGGGLGDAITASGKLLGDAFGANQAQNEFYSADPTTDYSGGDWGSTDFSGEVGKGFESAGSGIGSFFGLF